MSKHTPGPWNLRADPDDSDAWIIIDSTHGYFRVCDVSPRFETKEELYNARLIAAAPEMYRLLRYLHDHSNAKALLSDSYAEDLQAVLTQADGGGQHGT
jgi:hypothetical protein